MNDVLIIPEAGHNGDWVTFHNGEITVSKEGK